MLEDGGKKPRSGSLGLESQIANINRQQKPGFIQTTCIYLNVVIEEEEKNPYLVVLYASLYENCLTCPSASRGATVQLQCYIFHNSPEWFYDLEWKQSMFSGCMCEALAELQDQTHTRTEIRLNPTSVYLGSKGTRRTPSSRASK